MYTAGSKQYRYVGKEKWRNTLEGLAAATPFSHTTAAAAGGDGILVE